MITVETTEDNIQVTIPKGEVLPEQLHRLLDWLRLESLARRSHLTEDQAQTLAEESKAGWWTANKDRFIKPTA